MVEKPLLTPEQAAAKVLPGHHVMVGGFLGAGTPPALIAALVEAGTSDLTLIASDTGIYNPETRDSRGVAPLIVTGQCSAVIASHIGTNRETQRRLGDGSLEVTLVPQGTLAERIRAAGAGLGGVLTPTGIGTEVEEGKRLITVGETPYLLETALSADVALIYAAKGDRAGNLVFEKTQRNMCPLMATAATCVIAGVGEVCDIGDLDPERVVTPGLFVDYLVRGSEA